MHSKQGCPQGGQVGCLLCFESFLNCAPLFWRSICLLAKLQRLNPLGY